MEIEIESLGALRNPVVSALEYASKTANSKI